MKNIHVLPTDKPSRLHLWTDENGTRPALCELEYSHTRNTQNIYITSDEEIKEGNYALALDTNTVFKVSESDLIGIKKFPHLYKKIILTTDIDLIDDGVQSIPDEFLEWFVKNPSCEEVKIENVPDFIYETNHSCYKIIIPKEEPKQETLEEVAERLYPYEVGYGVFDRNCEIDIERERFVEGAKWQQEQNRITTDDAYSEGFENGKNWQAERMYSEEDMKQFGLYLGSNLKELKNKTIDEIFEQFKKK